jgi:hypothetical protein
MRHSLSTISLVVALLLLGITTSHAQVVISGGRLVGGATNEKFTNGHAIYGSVAQPLLYKVQMHDTVEKRIGIWEEASFIQSQYEQTSIELPNLIVQTGDTARVTVSFNAPCHFFTTDHQRPWELTLSFNRSMMQPLGFSEIVDDGSRYIVTYRGTTSAVNGTLANIAMLTRLGNDTITDIKVESFAWTDIPRQGLTATNGSLTQRGLCITEGSTRLVFERATPRIVASPNPGSGPVIRLRSYSPVEETGTVRILDVQGAVVHSFDGVPASQQAPLTETYAPNLPAGTYVIQLLLPSGTASTTIVRLP